MTNLKQIFHLFIIIIVLQIVQPKRLIFVEQIFRHGARYPINDLREGKLPQFVYQQNLFGELTEQGKHMHYVLGKMMYDKYWKALFGGTPDQTAYSPHAIYVRSTNVNRTIQSAQSQLQGIYSNLKPLELPIQHMNISLPPFIGSSEYVDKHQDNKTFFYVFGPHQSQYHPIPVHTVKESMISETNSYKYSANPYDQGEYLAKYQSSNCPNQQFWGKQNMVSPQALKIKQSPKVKELLSKLQKLANKAVKYEQVYKYYDQYQCLKSLGLEYSYLFKDAQFLKTIDFTVLTETIFLYFYTESQIKTSNTRLIQNTVNFMKQVISNRGPKLVLLSSHDTTVMSFLTAINLMSVQCIMSHFYDGVENNETCIYNYPDFASNVIIQLWQQDNLSHSIKVNIYQFIFYTTEFPRKYQFAAINNYVPSHNSKIGPKTFILMIQTDNVGQSINMQSFIQQLLFLAYS